MANEVETKTLSTRSTRSSRRRALPSGEIRPVILSGGDSPISPFARHGGDAGDSAQIQATQLHGNIPFEELIGGHLVAAVRAQGMAERELT